MGVRKQLVSRSPIMRRSAGVNVGKAANTGDLAAEGVYCLCGSIFKQSFSFSVYNWTSLSCSLFLERQGCALSLISVTISTQSKKGESLEKKTLSTSCGIGTLGILFCCGWVWFVVG